MNLVEQHELGVPAIHQVAMIGGQLPAEDVLFLGFAAVFGGRDVDPRRHAAVHVKVRVESPGGAGVPVLRSRRPRRSSRASRRCCRRRPPVTAGRARRHVAGRLHLRGQLADDFPEPFGIEHVGRFRERAQRGPPAAELTPHVLQLGRLLQGPQRTDARVEHEQQHQRSTGP